MIYARNLLAEASWVTEEKQSPRLPVEGRLSVRISPVSENTASSVGAGPTPRRFPARKPPKHTNTGGAAMNKEKRKKNRM